MQQSRWIYTGVLILYACEVNRTLMYELLFVQSDRCYSYLLASGLVELNERLVDDTLEGTLALQIIHLAICPFITISPTIEIYLFLLTTFVEDLRGGFAIRVAVTIGGRDEFVQS